MLSNLLHRGSQQAKWQMRRDLRLHAGQLATTNERDINNKWCLSTPLILGFICKLPLVVLKEGFLCPTRCSLQCPLLRCAPIASVQLAPQEVKWCVCTQHLQGTVALSHHDCPAPMVHGALVEHRLAAIGARCHSVGEQ